jgi:hypothetical protein
MNRSLRTVSEALQGKNDDAHRSAVAVMLLEHVSGFEANPFMVMHRHRVWPVYAAAVNAYFDGLAYVTDDAQLGAQLSDTDTDKRIDLRSKALACKQLLHEVAVTVLLWEQGASVHRQKSRALRDALMAVEET